MDRVNYIGSFPPPYGGVTIKNELLKRKLSERFDIFAAPNNNVKMILFLIRSLLGKSPIVVGVSAVKGKSRTITKLLYYFNKKVMRKSLYFMMGGLEASRIVSSPIEIRMYSTYKKVFVETKIMQKKLVDAGMRNIEVYPNCREAIPERENDLRRKNKCVFFSNISQTKGADMVLNIADLFPNILFDFYGEVDPSYKEEFMEEVKYHSNTYYKGIFHSNTDNVFDKLAEYDALLFPTRWKNEGVPGVIVEAKFAGIPTIASEIAYNADLIENDVDGQLFEVNSIEQFARCLNKIYADDSYLSELKLGSLKSAHEYDINMYLPAIISNLEGSN